MLFQHTAKPLARETQTARGSAHRDVFERRDLADLEPLDLRQHERTTKLVRQLGKQLVQQAPGLVEAIMKTCWVASSASAGAKPSRLHTRQMNAKCALSRVSMSAGSSSSVN